MPLALVLVNTNLEEPGAASELANKAPEQNARTAPLRYEKKTLYFSESLFIYYPLLNRHRILLSSGRCRTSG